MTRIFTALAALALSFSLTIADANADDDALNLAEVGDEAADGAFGKASALNDKLIDNKKKLEAIKASIEKDNTNPEVLKTATADLTALANDLKSVPDDIKAIIGEAKGVKLSGSFMAKAKKVKALAGNVKELGKVTTNATALIKEIKDTSASIVENAKKAAADPAAAIDTAKETADKAADKAVEAVEAAK
jgi:hypothetical protein